MSDRMTDTDLLALLHTARDAQQGGHFDDAQQAYETLLLLMPNPRVEADARVGLAATLHATGRPTDAYHELHRALELREHLGDVDGAARVHSNLALITTDLGEHHLAAEHLTQAIAVLGDQPDRAVQLASNLGYNHLTRGDLEGAERVLRDALARVTATTPARIALMTELNLAEALRRRTELTTAHVHYSAVIERCETLGLADVMHRALHGLGLLESARHNRERAGRLLERALQVAQGASELSGQLDALNGLAALHLADDPRVALGHARRAIFSGQDAGYVAQLELAHDLAARAHAALGNHERAYHELDRARCLERDARRAAGERSMQLLAVRHHVDQLRADRDSARAAAAYAEETVQQQLEELAQLTLYDPVTSLPNRVLYQDRLEQMLGAVTRDGRSVAVGVLNIARFRMINEALGHTAGDALLASVAERLSGIMRAGDTLAHLGADEFLLAMCLEDEHQLSALTQRYLGALDAPITVGGDALNVTVHLGLALGAGGDPDALVRRASSAVGEARRLGRRWHLLEHSDEIAPLALEHAMARAVREGQFQLHYQPIVEIATDRIVAVEALLRWRDPQRGLTMPGTFIGALERAELISEVGRWVLARACHDIAPLGTLRVGVNLSALQFNDPDLTTHVLRALHDSGMAPSRLELELTESAAVSNPTQVAQILGDLRAHGVRVSLDDFGTGHSSLHLLTSLPLDAIKIDRSFMTRAHTSAQDRAVVRTVALLARGLNLESVAEGIELPAQAQLTRAERVTLGQGWLYGRAVDIGTLRAALDGGAAGGERLKMS